MVDVLFTMSHIDSDYALALSLQLQYEQEARGTAAPTPTPTPTSTPTLNNGGGLGRPTISGDALRGNKRRPRRAGDAAARSKRRPSAMASPPRPAVDIDMRNLADPTYELTDPTPNIYRLFRDFDTHFFWGRLAAVELKWSPRMTRCAGVCSYQPRSGLCSVRLSRPLLMLRPRSDLVETLLHEMIHAFLFVTHHSDNRQEHGPEFHRHMHRINQLANLSISVYHTFHAEVRQQLQHWWRCTGSCRSRPPYFGFVKRSMNRAPSSRDFWWSDHSATCTGTFQKVREPAGYGVKKGGAKKGGAAVGAGDGGKPGPGQKDIGNYFKPPVSKAGGKTSSHPGSGVPPSGISSSGSAGQAVGGGGNRLGGASSGGIPWYKRDDNAIFSGGTSSAISGGQPLKQPDLSLSSAGGRRLGGAAIAMPWYRKQPSPSATGDRSASGGGSFVPPAPITSTEEEDDDEDDRDLMPLTDGSDVTCPVCDVTVRLADVNAHVDECLTRVSLDAELSSQLCGDGLVEDADDLEEDALVSEAMDQFERSLVEVDEDDDDALAARALDDFERSIDSGDATRRSGELEVVGRATSVIVISDDEEDKLDVQSQRSRFSDIMNQFIFDSDGVFVEV